MSILFEKLMNSKILLGIFCFFIIITIVLTVCFVYAQYQENTNDLLVSNPSNSIENIEALEQERIEEENIQNLIIAQLEKTPEETNNLTMKQIEKLPLYYIKVNIGAQVVTIYRKDEQGNYDAIKAMICSTGTHTPQSGVYTISNRWTWLGLIGDVYGQYSTQIIGNILFHSVPYLEKGNQGSLEYWEYDKLGTQASLGCVRLKTIDAKWIFDNCARGTKVEFYSDEENPGPLGKPSAQKISDKPEEIRNWDPTDPHVSNPWKSYQEDSSNA